jgi:hypothetical protein
MAHFAELDGSGEVLRVLVIADEDILDGNGDESEAVGIAFCKGLFGDSTNWVQTSYSTRGGVHLRGKTPFRVNFAGVGMVYNKADDMFFSKAPFPSWVQNKATGQWDSPKPHPDPQKVDQPPRQEYYWDEPLGDWKLIS